MGDEGTEAARALAGLRKKEIKVCPICGTEFEGLKRTVYCCTSCANKASYRRHAEERRADRRERYRQVAQRKQEVEG